MFRSNFIESSSKQCAFCNRSSADNGALVTHMGASDSKCNYHVNCVAAEILNDDCPSCKLPVNPRSLEQFKARTVEYLKPAVPSIDYEAEVEAFRQLEREFVQDRDAAEARAIQQQLDLEALEEKQARLENKLRGELEAQRLQEEFDAAAPDADFMAALSLHEELNEQPQQAHDELGLTAEELAEAVAAQEQYAARSPIRSLPINAFAERPAAPVEQNGGVRRCNTLSILTRTRLVCAVVAIAILARLVARF